jgi:hypothetical protein
MILNFDFIFVSLIDSSFIFGHLRHRDSRRRRVLRRHG